MFVDFLLHYIFVLKKSTSWAFYGTSSTYKVILLFPFIKQAIMKNERMNEKQIILHWIFNSTLKKLFPTNARASIAIVFISNAFGPILSLSRSFRIDFKQGTLIPLLHTDIAIAYMRINIIVVNNILVSFIIPLLLIYLLIVPRSARNA
jgi:hypothetical protein